MNTHKWINKGKAVYQIPLTKLPVDFLEIHVTGVVVPESRPVLNLFKLEAEGSSPDIFLSSDAIVIQCGSPMKLCSLEFDKLK